MKKRLFLGLAVIVSMTSGLLANGLNLNGFGARATAVLLGISLMGIVLFLIDRILLRKKMESKYS